MMKRRFRGFFFLIPVVVAVIAGLLALAVCGLWNGVLTEVAGVRAITYWQALGLLVLARILVGGFPRPGCGGGGGCGRGGQKMMMKYWESLTPEQREKLLGGDASCCWGAPGRGGKSGGGAGEPDAGGAGAAKV